MATLIRSRIVRYGHEWWSPLAVSVVLFLVSQNWSGLDTPDSEFYASLAIFTDQVTDRAPFDSYYWTRLGMILPAHSVISILGVWEGFAVYKAFLLLTFVTSMFALARRFTGFWRATWLSMAVSSSSIVMAYFGNPYVSATVLAGLACLLAFSVRDGLVSAIGSGVALGWLAMTYPTGALFGGIIWGGINIYSFVSHAYARGMWIRYLLVSGSCLFATVVTFWLIGRIVFPGLDWWETFRAASQQDHAVLGSGEWVWLRDISLLVPASTLILTFINRWRPTRKVPADLALLTSSSAITFYLVFAPIFGAQFLEAPLHQVLLWAPTLVAIVLVATSRMPDSPSRSPALLAVGVVTLVAIVAAGWTSPGWPLPVGVAVAAAMTLVAVTSPRRTLPTLIAMSVFLAGSQLLQNSRPQLGNFMLDPYFWAYTNNPNEEKLRAAVNAQAWLLENSRPDDQLLLWVDGPWREGDRELYSVAAMQLWGENRITLEPTLTDEYGLQRLAAVRPTALVLYGKSMGAVWTFWRSIPREFDPAPPECYDFVWPLDTTSAFPTQVGHTCVVRLK